MHSRPQAPTDTKIHTAQPQRMPMLRAMALLCFSGLVGLAAAYDPLLSWPMVLTLFASLALFFILIRFAHNVWHLSNILVVVAGMMALYFASQYAHFGSNIQFNYALETGTLAHIGRRISNVLPDLVIFVPHPNAVASFLEGVLFLAAALAWRKYTPKKIHQTTAPRLDKENFELPRSNVRQDKSIFSFSFTFFRSLRFDFICYVAATGLILYSLLLSGSRGAWLGLAIAAVVGVWVSANNRWRLWIEQAMLIFILLAILVTVYGWLDRYITAIIDAIMGRAVLYQNSLYLLGDYPFSGIGPGEPFALVYSRYQLLIEVPFLYYAHNVPLAVGLGHGVLGVIALLWLVIDFGRFVWAVEQKVIVEQKANNGVYTDETWLFRAAWLGLVASMVHGLVDAAQFSLDRWTLPMLFALLALTVIAGQRLNPIATLVMQSITVYRSPWRVGWIGGTIVLCIILFHPLILSVWYVNLGAIAHAQADLSPRLTDNERQAYRDQATMYYIQAQSWQPQNSAAQRRLGLLALDAQSFDQAVTHLAKAYEAEPRNPVTIKALGYAYLWSGELDHAEQLFRIHYDQPQIVQELRAWIDIWRWRNHDNLSGYASEMYEQMR